MNIHHLRPARGRRPARGLLAVGLLVTPLLAACQSAGAGGGGSDADAAAIVKESEARVKAAMADVTTGAPSSSPPVQKDKFVIMIPCSVASEGCAQPARAALDAAEEIGWRAQMIDGKDTADTQNAAVRQALALKPDGIITFAINPKTIQGALDEARRQGVKVVASSATKSDLVDFSDNPSTEAWKLSGSLLADYAITRTKGRVKALVLHDTGFDVLVDRHGAFVDRLRECTTCTIQEDQTFTFSDLANSVPRLVQQMAQRHPDFNTIYIDYDYAVPAVLQGLRSIGTEGKVVLGSDGTSAAIQLIREGGGQSATTAFALGWIGWSDVDALNRIFAGESPEPAAEVIGVKLIDQGIAQDIDGLWGGDVDYEAAYRTLWKVG
ncbi:substrate-binding domain-containing protein [Nocardioides sp. BYT-33-1]|uniref:substrate-binding domain-containing protein n=1 Tax=Nocardioides sp. BYT-33-1 TaxID=3416952 RepID=UPI003F538F9F